MTDEWVDFQRKHFEEGLADYKLLYGVDNAFQDAMTTRLLSLAGPSRDEEVLEIGCGVGRITIPLLRAGVNLAGLDISDSTLDVLQARVAELGLSDRFRPLRLAAEQIDFDNRFHLVIGRGVLHHIKDPVAVLARVRRALVPGGRAVFMDPNPINPGWIPLHLFHPALSISAERYLLRGTPARTRRMFVRAGLEEVRCFFAGLVPPPLWDLLPAADHLERALMLLPFLRRLSLYLIVVGSRPGEKQLG